MDEQGNIQDYSMIDDFISKNLADYNRKLFGTLDEQTGYYDEVDTEQPDEAPIAVDEEQSEPAGQVEDAENEDMNTYNSVFDNEHFGDVFRPSTGGRGEPKKSLGEKIAGIESQGNYGATNKHSSATGKYQFLWGDWGDSIKKVTGVKSQDEFLKNPKAQEKYYAFYEKNYLLPQVQKIRKEIKTKLTDTQLAKLVHFRGESGARQYLKGQVADKPEVHNIAISQYIKQAGGVPVARNKYDQHVGLNNDSLDTLFMPLEGINPIRGLDNGQPVYVKDSTGHEQILHGPEDIAYMTGGVYEKRVSKKYKTK